MIVQTIVGAVLLFSAPCPATPGQLAYGAQGCQTIERGMPAIYIRPDVTGKRYVWVWWHELGHVAEMNKPGAVAAISPGNELWAERFAACHAPRTRAWMLYRWWTGWTGDKRILRQRCAAWGVV